MHRFLALLAFTLAPAAQAQDLAPSFDCTKAESTGEQAVCANPALAALDLEVADLYARAAGSVTGDRLNELKAMQRGWIKGRDDCWKADDQDSCVRDEYALRIYDLRQGYAAAREAQGSTGPFPWVCEGMDVPLSTVFITHDPAALAVLRWGDNFAVLPIAESGSGARYSDGLAEFWEHQGEAAITLPDGTETTCTRDDMG